MEDNFKQNGINLLNEEMYYCVSKRFYDRYQYSYMNQICITGRLKYNILDTKMLVPTHNFGGTHYVSILNTTCDAVV